MQKVNFDGQATCSRGATHEGMPIMMICLEKNCNRKRLCCLSCIDELHVKHELMSLKKFYVFVQQTTNYNLNVKDKDETIKTIDTIHKSIKNSLEKIKNAFDTKINQISQRVQKHFEEIKESFIHEKLKNVCENIRGQFTDEKIQEYYQLIKKAEGNLSRPLDEIKKLVSTTQKSVGQKIVGFIKQIDKNADTIVKDVLQFKIAKSSNNKDEFNDQTKSVFLTIGEGGKTAKRTEGTGGYPIAVVKQPFSPDHHTVSFKITEQLGAKGIWMGVCALDVVKNLNYQSCYGIGKGTWGIDQVGQNHASAYSWSHHDTNYNSSPKVGWQFWIGDIVQITVDYVKNVARFCKNKQFYYQQPIKLDIGPLYAFAGPTHLNDTIAIV